MEKIHEIKVNKQTKFITLDQLNKLIENKIPYEKVGVREV